MKRDYGLISLQLALYVLVGVMMLGAGLWVKRLHHKATVDLPAAEAESRQLRDTLNVERENTRKANEASAKYQGELSALRADRANAPLPAVVCKPARVSAASTAAAGPDAARPADNAGTDEADRDIGPALDDFATACEANLIQLTKLQEWVRGR